MESVRITEGGTQRDLILFKAASVATHSAVVDNLIWKRRADQEAFRAGITNVAAMVLAFVNIADGEYVNKCNK